MVLEHDYPMTRTQVTVMVVGLVIMAAVGIALFGGLLPGVKPDLNFPSEVTINGQLYHFARSSLHTPLFSNQSQPWNVSFENVSFEFWLTNWYSWFGGVVHGVGTEVNGTAYAFEIGATTANGSRSPLYLSPDGAFGVAWPGGLTGGTYVDLLVRL